MISSFVSRSKGPEYSQLNYIANLYKQFSEKTGSVQIPEILPAVNGQHGFVIGPFEIVRKVGKGTVCRVMKVNPFGDVGALIPDLDLEAGLVLKLAKTDSLQKEEHRDWIKSLIFREGEIHSQLKGSAFTSEILDYGSICGRPFILERYINGINLRHANEVGIFPSPKETIAILIQVLEALKAPHLSKIIHRDIKTDNILLDTINGHIRLIDWGSAFHPKASNSFNPNGEPKKNKDDFKGAAALKFMAPEQLDDTSPSTPAMDIYSAFATAFFLIAQGESLLNGKNREELEHALLAGEKFDEQKLAVVPRRYQTLFLQSLAFNPAERAQSVSKLQKVLRKLLVQDPDQIVREFIKNALFDWEQKKQSL
ncbi:MAG: protein kinase [Bdellovibrionales bacterium]|nr:protein kinase [Bdellovibrionales bacterium]